MFFLFRELLIDFSGQSVSRFLNHIPCSFLYVLVIKGGDGSPPPQGDVWGRKRGGRDEGTRTRYSCLLGFDCLYFIGCTVLLSVLS